MQIQNLILEASDIPSLRQFYEYVLEMPVSSNKHSCTLSFGKTDIIFRQNDQLENLIYHYAITIPSNKIDEAKEWLILRVKLLWLEDYQSVIADFHNWNAKSVYFLDSAGNIVELIARFDLENDTNEPFNYRQLLSVSEIGLVFRKDEMEFRTKELMKTFSLPYFSKQQPLPTFKALGDDNGLFIIVPEKRSWYATNKPAEILPLDVEFENAGNQFHLIF
jgi:hypothetical protein